MRTEREKKSANREPLKGNGTKSQFFGKKKAVSVNNRPLAERRLQQVERKLVKDKKVAAAYQQGIDDYLQKNYI